MKVKRLLLIEDDQDTVQLIRALLASSGHWELRHVSLGQQVLASIQERRPDAILLDGHLPDMEGQEVLHLLSECPSTCSIPVISFSALGSLEGEQVVGIVEKPFQPMDFIPQLDALMG